MATAHFAAGRGMGFRFPPASASSEANEDINSFLADLPSTTFISDTVDASAPQPNAQLSYPPASSFHRHPPNSPTSYADIRDKLDISPENKQIRKDLLRESIFPKWRDAASSADLGHPNEMQKNDPLGIQIWKLYSKTKTQLPNQERMDNLTWRMMAMNLKRKEREQAR